MAEIQSPPIVAQTKVVNGKIVETNAPVTVNKNDGNTSGNPTQPAASRSQVANTSVGAANDNLAHVCDISGNLQYSIALASLKTSEIVEKIRTAVQAAWAGSSSSPFADEVRTVIKAIKAKVDLIKKYIKKIQKYQKAVEKFINLCKQLIAYINSLPAKIAALLKECLSAVTSGLTNAISNAKVIVTKADVKELLDAEAADQAANNATAGSSTSIKIEKP